MNLKHFTNTKLSLRSVSLLLPVQRHFRKMLPAKCCAVLIFHTHISHPPPQHICCHRQLPSFPSACTGPVNVNHLQVTYDSNKTHILDILVILELYFLQFITHYRKIDRTRLKQTFNFYRDLYILYFYIRFVYKSL